MVNYKHYVLHQISTIYSLILYNCNFTLVLKCLLLLHLARETIGNLLVLLNHFECEDMFLSAINCTVLKQAHIHVDIIFSKFQV